MLEHLVHEPRVELRVADHRPEDRARTADVEGAAAAGATVLRPVKDEFRATAPG
jgi:hypothetical protein